MRLTGYMSNHSNEFDEELIAMADLSEVSISALSFITMDYVYIAFHTVDLRTPVCGGCVLSPRITAYNLMPIGSSNGVYCVTDFHPVIQNIACLAYHTVIHCIHSIAIG